MKAIQLVPLLGAALLALGGCVNAELPEYRTSRDTLFHLQQLPRTKVAVGTFDGGPANLAGDPIFVGSGWDQFNACMLREPAREDGAYQNYIREALIAELSASGIYDAQVTDRVISGHVEALTFEAELHPFKRRWGLALTLASTNGRQMRVEQDLEFDPGALVGPTICNRAVKAFGPAVRGLIEKAVASPDFAALVA